MEHWSNPIFAACHIHRFVYCNIAISDQVFILPEHVVEVWIRRDKDHVLAEEIQGWYIG